MLPLRQRAACMARQARLRPTPVVRTARAFASTDSHGSHDHSDHSDHGHHDHHGESHASVDEPIGSAFFIAISAIPFSYLIYTLSRPGKDGQVTALESYLGKLGDLQKTWETRNTLHTDAIERAAQDKNLFYNVDRNLHVDLRYPEGFQTGSPFNVPAGHYANLDSVVAHYREQRAKEDARQAAAAASSKQ